MLLGGQNGGIGKMTPIRHLWIAWVITLMCQMAIMSSAFQIQPAGDDYLPPMMDIIRGEQDGPLALLTSTAHAQNHRPLQSLLLWFAGRAEHGSSRFPTTTYGMRAVGFGALAIYAFACGLLAIKLGIGRLGVTVAVIAAFFHPALPIMYAGIDGFSSLISAALPWFLASVLLDHRANRIGIWLTLGCICVVYAIALGFKEYALFCLFLLPATIWFWIEQPARMRRLLLIVGSLLIAITAVWWMWRGEVMAIAGSTSARQPTYSPILWMRNAAQMVGAALLPADTVGIFARRSLLAYVWAGASTLVFLMLLVVGMYKQCFNRPPPEHSKPLRVCLYLVLGMIIGLFPAVLLGHVSEQYVAATTLPLCILVGVAAEGWHSSPPRSRSIAFALFVLLLVSATLAGCIKIRGLREVGDEAVSQVASILDLVDTDHPQWVDLYFLERDENVPNYSVFAMSSSKALQQDSLDWYLDDSAIDLDIHVVSDAQAISVDVDRSALLWNPQLNKFVPIDHSAAPLEAER